MSLWALAGPSMQALMSKRVSADEEGQLQGALSSMRGICGMLGPILFTQVFAASVGRAAVVDLAGAPYLIAASLLFVSLLVAERASRRA